MSKRAAELVIEEISKKPNLVLGLPTGETPLGMYRLLVKAYKNKKISFSKIKSFNLDEYYPISKDNKNSYNYYMNKNFFKHVNLKKSNIHILDSESKHPIKDCLIYERKIKRDPIDLQILGVGRNGHIGFNEPGSQSNSRTRLVNLTSNTIKANSRFFKNKKEVPKKALTMGIYSILSAKKIILIANGRNKALAVKRLVEGRVSKKWPVSFLRRHKNLILIVDKDAGRLIR